MFIYLPSGAHAEKVGIDDYFAAGHTLDDVMALATPDLRSLHRDDRADDATYAATPAGLVWHKPTTNGPIPTPLTNFTAAIRGDIVEDDGAERRRMFEIEAALHGRPSTFQVPATQFAAMNWATEYLGAGAIVYPGFGAKDHARAAIQILSGDVPVREVFAHTGWRRIGDDWLFLHGTGAIGAAGVVREIETRLTGSLARFSLAEPPEDDARRDAVEASLRLWDLAPADVSAPLLATVYLSPLCELLEADRPDFVCWFSGPSGAFKSEAAALAEAHFGRFTRLTLPVSFADTANAVERALFSAKDVLVVVDDYHPAYDRREEQSMAGTASRILRGVGNGRGRNRMRVDTTLRPELSPRCLAIVTGERLPQGHSSQARMFPVAIDRGAIPPDRLTICQAESQLYPSAMAAYVQWIAGRFEELRRELPRRLHEIRDRARSVSGHPRDPGQVAHLQLGLETMLRFAKDVGAVAEDRAEAMLEASWEALLGLSHAHQQDLSSEAPVARLLALLNDGFASRRAYLEGVSGGEPEDAESWGWEPAIRSDRNGFRHQELIHPPGSTLLGRVDSNWLYLVPETTMQFITNAAQAGGAPFPVDQKTLLRRLDEDGLIATEDGGARRIVNARIGGGTRRVIKLARGALLPSREREQREQREHEPTPDSSVPVQCSRNTTSDGNDGNGLWERPDSRTVAVPVVPVVPAVGGIGDEEDREEVIL